MKLRTAMFGAVASLALAAPLSAQSEADTAAKKAAETEAQMTDEERVALTRGYLAMPILGFQPPEGARPGAGYVAGVPRLGVPPLWETDASLGVTWPTCCSAGIIRAAS